MGDTITIKQHDRRPYIRSQLLDGNGNGVALGGSDTVYFLMRPVSNPTQVLRVLATIIDAATGVVEHAWSATGAPFATVNETGTIGVYDQEWERLVGGTEPMTFPVADYNSVVILDDVDYP